MPDYFEQLKEFAMKASPIANAAFGEPGPGLKPASDFESEWVYGMPGKGGPQPRPSYSIGKRQQDILAREIRTLPEFEAPPGAYSSTEIVDPEELEALRREVANYAEKYGKYDPKDVARLAELEAMEGNMRSIKKAAPRLEGGGLRRWKSIEPIDMEAYEPIDMEAYERIEPIERWVTMEDAIEKAAPRLKRMEPMEPYERISPMVRPGVDAFESLMDSFGFNAREIPDFATGQRAEKAWRERDTLGLMEHAFMPWESVEEIPEGTRFVERSVEKTGPGSQGTQFYQGDDYDPREDILSASMPKRY